MPSHMHNACISAAVGHASDEQVKEHGEKVKCPGAEEQKEQPAVRVLDPPRHPGWKSKPKKLYIWLEVFFVAFILLYAYLLMCENLRIMKQENPEAYKDWDNLISDMKGDLKKKSPHK